jgi:competence protein ComEA
VIGQDVIDRVGRHRALLCVGILGVIVLSIAALLYRRPEPPRIVTQQFSARVPVTPQAAATIVVHLSGEIIAPGVYRLPVGSRIDDALKAGGGPTGQGDIHRLNLAARLADGQQIVIPKRVDPLLSSLHPVSSPMPLRVNLNVASVAELDGLPGVGPVTAQRIVAYREQHGPFSHVEQLRDAKLVSAATFEKIKELVAV